MKKDYKHPCYPHCIKYPACKNKTHITCPVLQEFWATRYLNNRNNAYVAWKHVAHIFPKLKSLSADHTPYNIRYRKGTQI